MKYKSKFNKEDVRNLVCAIPYGRATTYGCISEYLTGNKKSSQAVGTIVKNYGESTSLNEVYAHRVVSAAGVISTRKNIDNLKELKKENVTVAKRGKKWIVKDELMDVDALRKIWDK